MKNSDFRLHLHNFIFNLNVIKKYTQDKKERERKKSSMLYSPLGRQPDATQQ